jgi:hypothetical protein
MGRTFLRILVQICVVFPFLFFLNSSAALGQSTSPFFTPPTFSGSGFAVSADVNGDGKTDLIFLDGTVQLGKGDGTFTAGTPWTTSTSFTANEIVIADFNGDGRADILAAGPLNQLSVFLGNGDGTFQAGVTTAISVPVTSFVVGDLNKDGKLDVIAGNKTYLGKGDGMFAAGITSNVPDTFLDDAFADFNGDGKLDLFVFGQGIQLGNGDGTFQALLPFPTGSLTGAAALGDFDGDGKLDVATSGGTSAAPQLQVLFSNGDGTFHAGPLQSPPAKTAIANLVAGDFNGDGKADLVGTSANAVQVLLSKGDGSFTIGNFYNAPAPATFANLVVGDFNGDGRKDLAAFNTMLLGNGDGTLQGNKADLTLTGVGPSGDFNGDGFPDFATSQAISTSAISVSIWLNDGKQNFALAHTYQIALPTPGGFGGGINVAYAADINKDGKIDLVGFISDAGGVTVLTLLGNGDGTFGAPIFSTINTDGFALGVGGYLGDLNGDGKPDVLAIGFSKGPTGDVFYVMLNQGDGTFGPPSTPFVPGPTVSYPGGVALGDFNNDHKLDAIVPSSGGLGVLLGNGDGTFQPTTYVANTTSCGITFSGDFNGDGNLDLLCAVPNGGYQVLLGKGDGTFTLSPVVAGSFFLSQVADFNGDGHPDVLGQILQTNPNGLYLGLLLGKGDGTFGSPINLQVLTSSSSDINFSPLVGDFNQDGKPDIALLSNFQTVWLFNGTTGTGTTPPPPPPPDFSVGSGSGSGTATVSAGSTATYPVSLAGSGGFSGAVALTCRVAPAGPTCSVSPSSVTVSGGNAPTATVSVMTTARTGSLPSGVPSDHDSPGRIVWLFGALLAAAGVIALFTSVHVRPRRFSWSFATACGAILLLSATFIGGCGGGSNSSSGSGGSTATGTSAGSYTVTVSAQSGSVVHKTQLTLTVQ